MGFFMDIGVLLYENTPIKTRGLYENCAHNLFYVVHPACIFLPKNQLPGGRFRRKLGLHQQPVGLQ
jgi:hypothetical protein